MKSVDTIQEAAHQQCLLEVVDLYIFLFQLFILVSHVEIGIKQWHWEDTRCLRDWLLILSISVFL